MIMGKIIVGGYNLNEISTELGRVKIMFKQLVVGLISMFVFLNLSHAESFSVGQVWSYNTRPGEEKSKIIIVKIEMDKKQEKIFHIYVEGLQIQNRHLVGGIQNELPHAPISEKALKESVLRLEEVRKKLPDYTVGYGVWKESFDKGDGGVFTIPVAKIVQYIEDILLGGYDKKE